MRRLASGGVEVDVAPPPSSEGAVTLCAGGGGRVEGRPIRVEVCRARQEAMRRLEVATKHVGLVVGHGTHDGPDQEYW